MLHFIERLLKLLINVVVVLSSISLSFIVLVVTLNVVTRNLGRPVPGAFDFSTLGAAVSASLAIAYTAYVNGHVNIEIITEKLSPKLKRIQEFLNQFLFFLLFAVLAWQSYVTFAARFYNESTDILRVPYWPFRLLFFLTIALTALIALFRSGKVLLEGVEN